MLDGFHNANIAKNISLTWNAAIFQISTDDSGIHPDRVYCALNLTLNGR
jgi:hypothetical protein